jgi:hypothetical protein
LDSIRVIPVPFVLFDKNLFEPVRLARSGCLVHEGEIMKHDELLTASITPKGVLLSSCSLKGFLDVISNTVHALLTLMLIPEGHSHERQYPRRTAEIRRAT